MSMKKTSRTRNSHFAASFLAACKGIGYAVCRERNLRFHLTAGAFVLWLRGYYTFSPAQDAALFLTIGAVIAAELINTAVERCVDLCCPQVHPLAAAAKDTAAGAVLVLAIAAVGVGIRLFWQPQILLQIVAELFGRPQSLLLVAAAVAAGVWFVFFWPSPKSPNEENN